MVDVSMNRAVHLARRDAHYSRCVRLLKNVTDIISVARRRGRIKRILSHVQEAYGEARYALRGIKGTRAEKYFIKYLDLMYDAAKTAEVMVQHEALIREDKSFLNQFLGVEPKRLVQFEWRHRKMVTDVLAGMIEIASFSEEPYHELRARNMESLSPGDRRRYRSAYKAVIDMR